jgi:hypothetical protein
MTQSNVVLTYQDDRDTSPRRTFFEKKLHKLSQKINSIQLDKNFNLWIKTSLK